MERSFLVGQVLAGKQDAYEIVAEHARGGTGITYRARRQRDGAGVIIKALRLAGMGDWKVLELFERETAVLRALAHPGIPAWIDDFPVGAADAPTGFALVQELIPGHDLRHLLRSGARLSPAQMTGWLDQILFVLEYLQSRSPPVIHRDITPKNIILRPDGRAALVDFGSVQAALRDAQADLSGSSTVTGTFGYAPMDQFLGRATPASDLYGLAISYLAVATGSEPADMPAPGNRVDVRATLAAGDDRLLALLEDMTHPDPRQRVGSAALCRRRLAGGGDPVVTSPWHRDVAGYVTMLSCRLRADGFSVVHPGDVPSSEGLLQATRLRGLRSTHRHSVHLYLAGVAEGAARAPVDLEALFPFIRAVSEAHAQPGSFLSQLREGRAVVVPVMVAPAGVAPRLAARLAPAASRAGAADVLPFVVDLSSGQATILVEPVSAGVAGRGLVELAAYLAGLVNPRGGPGS